MSRRSAPGISLHPSAIVFRVNCSSPQTGSAPSVVSHSAACTASASASGLRRIPISGHHRRKGACAIPGLIPRLHGPIGRYFRTRRFQRLARAFGLTASTRVLDIGGYAGYWRLFQPRPRVTLVNLEPPAEPVEGIEWVIADARRLPFADRAFDLAFCNSVIEHVPGEENRQAVAREVDRVGRGYYVQTPYRWFPVEPHLMTPLIHYLPRRWQRPLLPYTVWGLFHRPTPQGCDDFLRDIRLLTTAELRRLFPGAEIWRERAAGLLKSIAAVRRI